jgi:putative ribosome biogenesis GTPase RsgA
MLTIKNLDSNKQNDARLAKLNPMLPRPPFRLLIIGSSGSGKTNLLVNLFEPDFYGKFWKKDHIIVFSPTADFDDKQLKIPSNNFYAEFNPEILEFIMYKQTTILEKHGKKKLDHILIVLDDMLGNPKAFGGQSFLNKFIIKCRHYNISIVILSQKLSAIGRTIRLNIDSVIIFRAINGIEIDEILDEYSSKTHRKTNYEKLMSIWSIPYNFLYANFQIKDRDKIYRSGFNDEIITFL